MTAPKAPTVNLLLAGIPSPGLARISGEPIAPAPWGERESNPLDDLRDFARSMHALRNDDPTRIVRTVFPRQPMETVPRPTLTVHVKEGSAAPDVQAVIANTLRYFSFTYAWPFGDVVVTLSDYERGGTLLVAATSNRHSSTGSRAPLEFQLMILNHKIEQATDPFGFVREIFARGLREFFDHERKESILFGSTFHDDPHPENRSYSFTIPV
jgi:hypothetical protein